MWSNIGAGDGILIIGSPCQPADVGRNGVLERQPGGRGVIVAVAAGRRSPHIITLTILPSAALRHAAQNWVETSGTELCHFPIGLNPAVPLSPAISPSSTETRTVLILVNHLHRIKDTPCTGVLCNGNIYCVGVRYCVRGRGECPAGRGGCPACSGTPAPPGSPAPSCPPRSPGWTAI